MNTNTTTNRQKEINGESYVTTRAARLREIDELIAVATLARRYALTKEDRARAEAILERASDEKWMLWGV